MTRRGDDRTSPSPNSNMNGCVLVYDFRLHIVRAGERAASSRFGSRHEDAGNNRLSRANAIAQESLEAGWTRSRRREEDKWALDSTSHC